jgi:hypothetical protein
MRTVSASAVGVTERIRPPGFSPVNVIVASISVFCGKFFVRGR